MSIRQTIQYTSRNISSRSYTPTISFIRSLYLHKGPRVEGLKRDPKEVFVNHNGTEYELNQDNIQHIKSYLGSRYQIPDEIALQIITHKSFGNGIKPYNEKLAAMGSKLLSLFAAKHVVKKHTEKDAKLVIEGKNLSILGSRAAKELYGRSSTGYFAKLNGLNNTMFWKSRNPTLRFESSGELKVSSQLLYSLIGAVNIYHGKAKAEEFISENLIKGLEEITKELVHRG
ncbi:hypothetical protein KGF57_004555 [Candida theae]|uniref:RNase III domain-containing protein n=1 Tax=Candida theae TaxID=1198502 RepID=A0AAD5FWR9_9ASCO|nr:uncharacterized protein KGF57_004555 [Candida theae]KAI5949732.1 hypothetical protein KGF57_004555 [Candida theae]